MEAINYLILFIAIAIVSIYTIIGIFMIPPDTIVTDDKNNTYVIKHWIGNWGETIVHK